MKIVADRNIPGLLQTFGQHGDIVLADGRNLRSSDLEGAQALIVRSVTPVNATLLSNSSVAFVGTTTIGTDHVDTSWLEQNGIQWANAPGCNAEGTAQYTLAMALLACERAGVDFASSSVGIVGCGNVGGRVRELLEKLHAGPLLVCDPYLAAAGQTGLSELDALSDCEVLTFHVPLTKTGDYPTHHLISRNRLAEFRRGALLVNTSRGDIADGPALLEWLKSGYGFAALDVWPGEPWLDPEILRICTVATPHVAGYSLDGKLRGTDLVYRRFCQWLGIKPRSADLLVNLRSHMLPGTAATTVSEAILAACPIERDDLAIRRLLEVPSCQRSTRFDELRGNYPERRDFAGWNLPSTLSTSVASQLRTLGFH